MNALPPAGGSTEYVPNNLVWAILTTLFCCLPLGIVSIVHAAKVDGKPIIMDMWTPWCGWCKRMDAATFNDDQTAAYINANFHAVSFNAEGKDPVTFNGTVYENKEFNPSAVGGRNGTHEQVGRFCTLWLARGIANFGGARVFQPV